MEWLLVLLYTTVDRELMSTTTVIDDNNALQGAHVRIMSLCGLLRHDLVMLHTLLLCTCHMQHLRHKTD